MENERATLVNFFSQKSNAHIGYLIAIALALVGTLNTELLNILHFNIIIFIAIIFIVMVYFVGRALYYAYLIESAILVNTYTREELITTYPKVFNKQTLESHDLNSLYLLNRAALDLVLRHGKYSNNPFMGSHVYIARFFNNKKSLIPFVSAIGILIVVNYCVLIFPYIKWFFCRLL